MPGREVAAGTSSSSPQARAATPTSPISIACARVRAPVPSKRPCTDGASNISSTASRTSRMAASRRRTTSAARSSSRSKRTPPGRTRPRPKRLPQSTAVMLRRSPRSRPQYDAVGRKPTSPASAPRSPTWLAMRSSSSATPRTTSARGGSDAAGERLERLAVGGRVGDRGVAGGGLHEVDGARRRAAGERPLDPAVLVAERDLEVEHVLAVALEAEVAGLDDAGVDRPDRHLVDLVAVDAVEVGDPDRTAREPPGRRARYEA